MAGRPAGAVACSRLLAALHLPEPIAVPKLHPVAVGAAAGHAVAVAVCVGAVVVVAAAAFLSPRAGLPKPAGR